MEYYTSLDVIKLGRFILEQNYELRYALFEEKVLSVLRALHREESMPEASLADKILKEWLTKKEIDFVYGTPLRKVPLFMRREDLKFLVKWRLDINK